MATQSAWAMISARVSRPSGQTLLSAGDAIQQELHDDVIEVIGPYDAVVEVKENSLEEIYEHVHRIACLETVAGATTYVTVKQGGRKLLPTLTGTRVCIMVDATAREVESVWRMLQEIHSVETADIVLGAFDIIAIARVELACLSAFLGDLVQIPGILRTVSMLELEVPGRRQSKQ